jgi:hypothetical protein
MVDNISRENAPWEICQNPKDTLAAITPSNMTILANNEFIISLH